MSIGDSEVPNPTVLSLDAKCLTWRPKKSRVENMGSSPKRKM